MVQHMDKIEQRFSQHLKDETHLEYPDFDAMWRRLEPTLPEVDEKLQAVDWYAPKRRNIRKVAFISLIGAVLLATPVVAAISGKWDNLLTFRSGIQSALVQGLGQSIEKSVTHENVTFTINTAIVDDNRTVLLYSLEAKDLVDMEVRFTSMQLKDSKGQIIEGQQSLLWDKDSQTWRGYFETEWTPDHLEEDVQFSAKNLKAFARVEHPLEFNPFESGIQVYPIGKDGVEQLTIQPFEQGEKMMLFSSVKFNDNEAKTWAFPRLAAFQGDQLIKEAGNGAFGTPGEHGEYTGQQFYKRSDLEGKTFSLHYTREEKRIEQEWAYDLHLDKRQMLSGTVKRKLNIPLENSQAKMVLEEMTVTPTQIRIKAKHDKYQRFPFVDYTLIVDGIALKGGIWWSQDDPNEDTFRFELPQSVRVNENLPITFVAKHEIIEHKGSNEPIRISNISEEKKTITTDVGGYSVTWTYYKQDGNLYVQSESADPTFGGINQTYTFNGKKRLVGKPVSVNFSGDGNNQAIDVYENYERNEADLYIFYYKTENPNREMRVELNP
jgi:hypothetical protein